MKTKSFSYGPSLALKGKGFEAGLILKIVLYIPDTILYVVLVLISIFLEV